MFPELMRNPAPAAVDPADRAKPIAPPPNSRNRRAAARSPGRNRAPGWLAPARLKAGAVAVALFLGRSTAPAAMTEDNLRAALAGVDGTLVVRACATGEEVVWADRLADTPFGPCSTFKIWNSLIGLEAGLIGAPDDAFWTWDLEVRPFPAWNADQTWRSAFAGSCVPAFQDLARRIGPDRMQAWLEKLKYGTQDQCGRPDAFWLPRAGRSTILITPREQARMICRMVRGELPLKASSVDRLMDVMRLATTSRGTLYGKTGSGLRTRPDGPKAEVDFDMGWLVGFVESQGLKYAYACLVLGDGLTGKDARAVVETAMRSAGWW
jgi:beta-lactamase class D